ncbi:hypothetical protein OIU78_013700 [Salix suchowensis]|nr:hypothetical protein OIU78_013700 [Salix suchowensis]
MEAKHISCFVLLVGFVLFQVNAEPVEDKQALLDFVNYLPHSRSLNWKESSPVCNNWSGVNCSADGTRVIAVRMPGVGFHGPIPPNTLSRLSALQYNNLSGSLPFDFSVWPNLTIVNLIPRSLRRFPNSMFSGNNIPFETFPPHASPVITPSATPYPKSKNSRGLGEKASLGIIAAACVLGTVAFVFLIVTCCSRKKGEDEFSGKLQKGGMSPEKVVSRSQDANNRLTFFEGCNYAFDLEDLLRASAEVLGKGAFGMAYKAILEDATTVVVKRLKEVSVGKRDFEQQMEVVGSIRHENVVELKAYYYSKDEKLMVYDYYSKGSIASMLHAKRGGERIPLDWDTRMRIAIGAARGIARIHAENGGKFVHGNIKSSNIFLNSRCYGCVSDLGLATITSSLAPPIARAAGYHAPEVADTRKAAQEEWTAEVFDVELMRYPNIEEEMVEMLQIAMSCVVRTPDQRPEMTDVVKMIENVRQINTENRQPSESRSESCTPPPLVVERES